MLIFIPSFVCFIEMVKEPNKQLYKGQHLVQFGAFWSVTSIKSAMISSGKLELNQNSTFLQDHLQLLTFRALHCWGYHHH